MEPPSPNGSETGCQFAPMKLTMRRAGVDMDHAPTPATSVEITSQLPDELQLLVTFKAHTPATQESHSRVAAIQPVFRAVRIDLSTQARLHWLATVLEKGAPSANQASCPFVDSSQSFTLRPTPEIALEHDDNGFRIPPYDSTRYRVGLGFGLELGSWVYWGFSMACTPNQVHLPVAPVGYGLVRGSGSERVGAAIDPDLAHWIMGLGHAYALNFAGDGQGTLTKNTR